MNTLKGIPASYGIAIGPAYVFTRVEIIIEPCKIDDPGKEWQRFLDAKADTGISNWTKPMRKHCKNWGKKPPKSLEPKN